MSASINTSINLQLLPDPEPALRVAASSCFPIPPLKSISQLECIPADDHSFLLSNRLLRRGETAGLVGPSGLGKSTTAAQMSMQWSAGKPALGLTPLEPMRIVMVQGENDEAEMSMLTRGILHASDFTPEEAELVEENFVMAEVTSGEHLIPLLRGYIAEHNADLVIIDPLFVYFTGEVSSASEFGGFLRDLALLFKELNVAVMFVHHTGKKKTTPGGGAIGIDAVYGGIGSSEFSNVCRVIFTLDNYTKIPGYAKLMIGKRGGRSPWIDADGKRMSEIVLEPSGNPEIPFWRRAQLEDIMHLDPSQDRMTVGRNAVLSALRQGDFAQNALQERVHAAAEVSRETFLEVLPQLANERVIESFDVPRPRTRPEIWWRLAPQVEGTRDNTAGVITGINRPLDV